MEKKKITKEAAAETVKAAGKVLGNAGEITKEAAGKAIGKGKEFVGDPKAAVIQAIDQDGNGQIDVTDIIIMALKVPGVKVKRAEFLQKELFKNHTQEQIELAIATTPANAGISREEVDKLANDVIKFERNAVSGISTALGIPGGVAMAATIPADIAQYYGYMLRAAQKLLYLYGFPELNTKNVMLDSETMNSLTICLGIMNGVAGANNALKGMAKALATGVEKKLLKAALTKGTIYPIVKSVAKWFGIKMTKQVFAGFFKKAIPVVGGVVGGGLTFATFKPCCDRLQAVLKDTLLSNPDHKADEEENEIYQNIVDAEFVEIEDDNTDIV